MINTRHHRSYSVNIPFFSGVRFSPQFTGRGGVFDAINDHPLGQSNQIFKNKLNINFIYFYFGYFFKFGRTFVVYTFCIKYELNQ